MHVLTLRTTEQQEKGVLPFMAADGSITDGVVFFFPYAHSQTLSGVGLRQPIRAYALDLNFKILPTPFGKRILLQSGDVFQLPPQTIHVVETSFDTDPISDFSFLRKEVNQ